jgi:hypothetical protein
MQTVFTGGMGMNILKGRARALLVTAALAPLAACATGGVPKVSQMTPSRPSAVVGAVGNEFDTTRPALRRVRLTGDFFALKPVGGDMPADIANARVRLDFGGQQPTFDDLTMLLEDRGLSVILGWDDGSYGQGASVSPQQTPQAGSFVGGGGGQQNVNNPFSGSNGGQSNGGQSNGTNSSFQQGTSGQQGNTPIQSQQPMQAVQTPVVQQNFNQTGGNAVSGLRGRPLPFRRFEGTLGGLFRQLQRSMGVTIWWNDGIYVSPVGRYSVMLPQNKDLMSQVVTELQAKGASNVVASIQAGTVSFVAPGALAEEVIKPYLIRLGRNASEVTMQIALVSVVMNEQTSRGFDWSQFSLAFGTDAAAQATSGLGGLNGNTDTTGGVGGIGTGGTGTGTGVSVDTTQKSTLFKLTNDAARLFVPGVNIFGTRQPLDIGGAIKFLSQYGNTAVDQNVELRTLAGTAVNWRSGETIPYVSGVSATTTGGIGGNTGGLGGGGLGGAIGSAQTEKLETGLTLNLAPTYESNGGLVTVSFKLELTELIEFVQLNAGNQLGSFTQPRTREQKLDDIVRIPVGETVVLGGLRRQLSSTNRTGPFSAYSIGSRSRNNEVQTIFVILRPSVTTYEVSGLDQPLPSKLNSLEIGTDGRPWQPPQGDYRGTNMFGEAVNGAGPDRRRSMNQPKRN